MKEHATLQEQSAEPKGSAANLCPEARILEEWRLATENRTAPLQLVQLANTLAHHHEMAAAWRILRSRGDVAMPVLSLVHAAYDMMLKEARRPTVKDERNAVERVKRCARALKSAINLSPLPKNEGQLDADGLVASTNSIDEPIMLFVGWCDVPGIGLGYRLSIIDVIDRIEVMADAHLTSMYPRAVTRDRGQKCEAAFIRWLTVKLDRHLEVRSPTAVGHIASAVFNRGGDQPPITDVEVENIMKDCPEEVLAELTRKTSSS